MKKTYSKPQIAYESFEMSQSIAANCEYISNLGKFICSIEIFDGFTIFTDGSNGCDSKPPEGDNKICYDVPSDYVGVFSS